MIVMIVIPVFGSGEWITSCSEQPARAEIDPLPIAYYEELKPRLIAIGFPSIDIPCWVADFWHHADA